MSPTTTRYRLLRIAGAGFWLLTILLLAADASEEFRLVSLPLYLALAAGSVLWMAIAAIRRRGGTWRRDRIDHAILLSLLGALLLCLNPLIRMTRLQSLPARTEEMIEQDVIHRADLVQQEFDALLRTLQEPLDRARPALEAFRGAPEDTFDFIESLRDETGFISGSRGLSIYSESGQPLAWTGTSYPAPPGLLDDLEEMTVVHRAVAEQHLARLYGILKGPHHVLVSEVTVFSRLAPQVRDTALPSLSGSGVKALRLQDFRATERGFDNLFARHDDRLWSQAERARELRVALRSPDRTLLGFAQIQPLGSLDLIGRLSNVHRFIAAIILTAFFAALSALIFISPGASRDDRPWRPGRTAAGLATIWSWRILLSRFPLHTGFLGVDLFDSSLFASKGFFNLIRSPADLLLTAVSLFLTSLALHRMFGRLSPRDARTGRRGARWAGLSCLVLLAIATWRYLPALAEDLVSNSRVNLLRVDLFTPEIPALVMQFSALVLLLSWVLLAQGLLILSGPGPGSLSWLCRSCPRPHDGISRWVIYGLLPALFLSAVLFDPLIVASSQTETERLLENLLPEVAGQRQARAQALRAACESLEQMADLPDRIMSSADRDGTSTALGVWLDTPLAGFGYHASLIVEDDQGRIISRFASNLPPQLDMSPAEKSDSTGCEPVLESLPVFDIRKSVLHVGLEVESRGTPVGRITLHLIDEFDNLPFLTPETPYGRALAPLSRRIDLSLPGPAGILYAVYRPDGRMVYSHQRSVPPLPADYGRLVSSGARGHWTEVANADSRSRYLFFSNGEHLFALGYARPLLLGRIARGIRVFLIGLVLFALILVPFALLVSRGGPREAWSRVVDSLGRTHYRKLLVTFSAAALIPIVAVSILMSNYTRSEIDKDIEEQGRRGIESLAHLMRTILQDPDISVLDDNNLYWLGLVVREDVNLYEDGVIAASSNRELFTTGLVPPRLDGEIYRELIFEGHSFAMGRHRLKNFGYRTISSAVYTEEPQRGGLISIPLDAQAAEVILRAQQVADVMLITFVGMVLLMGIVGYVLARRVSRPIRSLNAAAASIASGNLDAIVEERPRDETGELISSFNEMAQALKRQRQALEQRRDYIEKILQNATIGVISMDRSGRVVTANPAAGVLLDLADLAPGANLISMLEAQPHHRDLATLVEKTREAPSENQEISLPASPHDRNLHARAIPFLDGEGLILLLEDVTETVRSNRLAAWAEMARRIAHEIKNPLTPIQLSAEHIRRVHAEGGPEFPEVLEQCLRTIMNEVGNLRQISAEFSTYARIPTPRKEPTPMSEFLERVVRPYRVAVRPGLSLDLDIPPGLPTLLVDQSLLSRALINLIENSLQAMPNGGRLSIGVRASDDHVSIEVSDTGVGMDSEALARLFEPYFSTKDTGTGLGLAIARNAIEEHSGRIEVESVLGRGTTMKVLLPTARTELTGGPAGTVGKRRG